MVNAHSSSDAEWGMAIPTRVLTSSLARSLFSCLQPTRIPSHPLDTSDTIIISEAVDALNIYTQLASNIFDDPRAFEQGILSGFSDDEDLPWLDLPPCHLRSDGYAVVSFPYLVQLLTMILGALGLHTRGVPSLLAHEDLTDIVFDFFTYDPHPKETTAINYHRFFMIIECLLQAEARDMKERMQRGVASYDEKYPGRIICTIAGRISWFFNDALWPPNSALNDKSCAESYGKFFTAERMTSTSTIVHLQAARPTPMLVRLLARETARPAWLNGPEYRQFFVGLWTALICQVVITRPSPSPSYSSLISALRNGLLPVVHRILVTLHPNNATSPASARFRTDCRREALRLIDIMLQAIIWPRVLRAFDDAFKRDQCAMLTAFDPEEWQMLLRRYLFYRDVRLDFKDVMVLTLGSEETSIGDAKLALAAESHTAARPAKLNIGARHIVTNAGTRRMSIRIMPDQIDGHDSTSAFERAFLLRCARECLIQYGEPDCLRSVRTVLVDFADVTVPYPPLLYGEMDNAPFPLREPDPNTRYLHIFIRASRGSFVTVIAIDDASHDIWMQAAGCRRRIVRNF
ncbi:hypothetical protein K523DRAFT_364626 [Schizophyllum commune Tattone D]|nr:hypothetical protein K523DRAFT_364626 [Schizophyllum commune Tattone D]